MFYSYWTSASFAVLSVQRASYVISVRQTRVLSTASFRFHLAMDTLAFNYTLTTAGRIRDLHPLEFAHAGQTKKDHVYTWSKINVIHLELPELQCLHQ